MLTLPLVLLLVVLGTCNTSVAAARKAAVISESAPPSPASPSALFSSPDLSSEVKLELNFSYQPPIKADVLHLKTIYIFLYHFTQQLRFDAAPPPHEEHSADGLILHTLNHLDWILHNNCARLCTQFLLMAARNAFHLLSQISIFPYEKNEPTEEDEAAAFDYAFANPGVVPGNLISIAEERIIHHLTDGYNAATQSLTNQKLITRQTLLVLLATCHKMLLEALTIHRSRPAQPVDAPRLLAKYAQFLKEAESIRRAGEAIPVSEATIQAKINKTARKYDMHSLENAWWFKIHCKSQALLKALKDKELYPDVSSSLIHRCDHLLQVYCKAEVIKEEQLYEAVLKEVGEAAG